MQCLKQGGVSLIGRQRFLTQEQCRKSFIRRNKNPHINEKVHIVRALQSTLKVGAHGPLPIPKHPSHGQLPQNTPFLSAGEAGGTAGSGAAAQRCCTHLREIQALEGRAPGAVPGATGVVGTAAAPGPRGGA